MSAKSLTARVAALEAKVGSKSIEEQFREQAELIDRLFAYRFEEHDKKIDIKLAALEERLEARLEAKLETKLETKLEEKFEKLEARLEATLEAKLEAKLETKLEEKLEVKLQPIRSDLAFLKDSVTGILDRLN